MGLRTYRVSLNELSKSDNLRLWKPFELPKLKYPYQKFNKLLSFVESGTRPKGGLVFDSDEGAISLGGEQIGSNDGVDLSITPFIDLEYFESAKKGFVKDDDVLMCKDGSLTGKTCLVDMARFSTPNVMVNEHVLILRSEIMSQKLLYFLTTTSIFQDQIKDIAYHKKAQPGLNQEHIRKLKIPNVPPDIAEQLMQFIDKRNKIIDNLMNNLVNPKASYDKVLSEYFDIDLDKVKDVSQNHTIFKNFSELEYKNVNFRTSFGWNQLHIVQREMYKNVKCVDRLGRYILKTQNGWSPECTDIVDGTAVVGVDSIRPDTRVIFSNLKYTQKTKKNMHEYFLSDGDFLVSRGNTQALVALASIVPNDSVDQDIIFPDLLIRVTVNEKYINRRYLSYIFNSSIGRLYFKYSAKGKNLSMVKISSQELNEFYLPIPAIEEQIKLVEIIDKSLSKNDEIELKIRKEREELSNYINSTILA